MRIARKEIISEYTHVVQRGLGKRLIFEDNSDMRRFLLVLQNKLQNSDASVLAWCLMSNHFHLLIRASQHTLSRLMQRVETSYAQYFNGKHGHVGRVFQSRFYSMPIKSDSHLLSTIRYIHKNPETIEVGMYQDYVWSSYREIAGYSGNIEGGGICKTFEVIKFFGDINSFKRFHAISSEEEAPNISESRSRLSDAEARRIAINQYGEGFADSISEMPKKTRNNAIANLKSLGLSIRQIERITGIGRSIIERA